MSLANTTKVRNMCIPSGSIKSYQHFELGSCQGLQPVTSRGFDKSRAPMNWIGVGLRVKPIKPELAIASII